MNPKLYKNRSRLLELEPRLYDPDVFLPTPFDAFLLSGDCAEAPRRAPNSYGNTTGVGLS